MAEIWPLGGALRHMIDLRLLYHTALARPFFFGVECCARHVRRSTAFSARHCHLQVGSRFISTGAFEHLMSALQHP